MPAPGVNCLLIFALSLLTLAGCYDGPNQCDCSQRGTASIPGCFDY